MVAPLPSQTITGTSAADIRASTPGTNALVETFQAGDTITLNNEGDYALSGDGADVILVGGTASVSLSNSVVAGFGQDTISIGSAAGSLASNDAYLAGNQGNDYITLTAAAATSTFNGAFIGGGLNNDTISLTNVSSYINSSVKGGDNGDSIVIVSGSNVSTIFEGNKGADTIRYGATAATNGSLGGGAGHDTITIGTAAAAVVSWINGGAGLDSILIDTGSSFSTLAGGGLADTITFRDDFLGGVIYGDGVGVTSSGSGSAGTADGADRITGIDITTGATIYGAGGADTIRFNEFTGDSAAAFIDGGDGADLLTLADILARAGTANIVTISGGKGADTITLTTAAAGALLNGGEGNDTIFADAGSALSINGGAGTDTIVFVSTTATSVTGGDAADIITFGTAVAFTAGTNNLANAATIDGGNGSDTISLQAFTTSGQSIAGGAGNDSIRLGTASDNTGLAWASNGTINGGAGVDSIVLSASAGGGVEATTALTKGVASIAYESGDVIVLASTAASGNALNGAVYVGDSAIGISAVGTLSAGTLAVYSDGTDSFFAFKTNDANSAVIFRVTGADLVSTAVQNAITTTANVSFSIGGSADTGITITLA
ncbi:calcium-binding protein [Synechococcus sp. HK01-R]|uniref:beta strand repeat-containing protein n=1 Tax=Synechococcus sp. HK01-R TaxID=2751171 RepID=UPI001625C081|nr:calcium-binding protein [Synechococcus sp. HK01-R]QNG27759.1 calcium-binding protein [Synechococcus sp. HK01-R]